LAHSWKYKWPQGFGDPLGESLEESDAHPFPQLLVIDYAKKNIKE
jgi:hypothetical protein